MAGLFDPLPLGSLTLNNRIALAPMTRSRGTDDHVANSISATYYAQRASGGLLITEGTPISQQGVGYVRVPGIWSDAQIEAWREITSAVHAEGGKIFAQIWHVGRISHVAFQPNRQPPVAPSALAATAEAYTPEGPAPTSVPVALSEAEIDGIVEDFAQAARNAVTAGFDGVEIHGANGYLLEQFLFSGSNKRTDGYGGSASNRARFTLEVVDAVISAIGGDRVGLRISPQNTFNGSHDDNRPETFAALVHELRKRALVYVHVVEPTNTPTQDRILPSIREGYTGVILTNGGYDKTSAEAVVARGEADVVAFGVPFLANPDLPARLRLDAPLNPPNPDAFYTPGVEGYSDYPTLEAPFVRLIALEVTNPAEYDTYRGAMRPLLATYGGCFILDVLANEVRVPRDINANRIFAIAFPSEAAAGGFFSDERYLQIKAAHFERSTGRVVDLSSILP